VVLVVLELVSQVLVSRSSSNLAKRLKDLLRFEHPWDVTTLLVWLILAFLSAWYDRNESAISYAFLAAGIMTFLLGWTMRYQVSIVRFISRHFTPVRAPLRHYIRFWSKLELSPIHVRFLWPWLEIVGVSLVSRAFTFFPAFFIFPVIVAISIVQKGRRLAVKNPDIRRSTLKDFLPMPRHVLLCVLVPFVVGIIVGVAMREVRIFYGDTTTTKSLLLALSTIEGSIGILAITIIFVLSQLTASSYSIRISRILFRQPAFWVTLLILLTSVLYNLIVVARAPFMFPTGDSYFYSGVVDTGFILAIASACAIAYFVYSAPRIISPEYIVGNALRSLDAQWLDAIKQHWGRPAFQIRLEVSDPFVVIERVLSKAVDSGDSLTFVSGLVLIRDHLRELSSAQPTQLADSIIEIDAYFHHHFRSITRRAGSNSDAYTLLNLIYFIEELGKPSPKSIAEADTFAFGFTGSAGELLVREIIKQSAEHGLVECATRGIHIVESRASDVIKVQPKQKDTWLFDPTKRNLQESEDEKKRLWGNDFKVQNFEQHYLSYLEEVGVAAAKEKSPEIVRCVVRSLNNIISSIVQDTDGSTMKAMMVQRAVFSIDAVRRASCDNGLSHAMTLAMLDNALNHIDAEHEEMVAWRIISYVSDYLVSHAKLGLLDYMDVIDSAMCGIATVENYTKPTIRLLRAYGEAAELVRSNADYAQNRDLQLVYAEIVRRIRQVGQDVPKKDREKMLAVTREILDDLVEPEFEARGNL
jgi:hypothetical protein